MELFGVPLTALYGQLVVGLVNGSFYAVLSLGLAVIFGMLKIVNFVHGALYMLGAVFAWILTSKFGLSYWWALLLAPLVVGAMACIVEITLLRRLYKVDHVYGMLFTLGLAYVVEGLARHWLGVSGKPFAVPEALQGVFNMGFMRLPVYRVWVIAASATICLSTWFIIERTSLGAYLRAATENAPMTRARADANVPMTRARGYANAPMTRARGYASAPILHHASVHLDSISGGELGGPGLDLDRRPDPIR